LLLQVRGSVLLQVSEAERWQVALQTCCCCSSNQHPHQPGHLKFFLAPKIEDDEMDGEDE
jgi:hypothetical protein